MKPSLVLLAVKDPAAKLQKICETALHHFSRGEPLWILVPEKNAQEFVDALLWRLPEESFLPHGSPTDLITISTQKPVDTPHVFNLLSTPYLEGAKTIYDFEDLTTVEKRENSKKKYYAYRDAGFSISSLPI